jgi:hypothetical protein
MLLFQVEEEGEVEVEVFLLHLLRLLQGEVEGPCGVLSPSEQKGHVDGHIDVDVHMYM